MAPTTTILIHGPRPRTHAGSGELAWFDSDPSEFVERARVHAADYPGLDERLATCRRAAWTSDCYLTFAEIGHRRVVETAVFLENGEHLAVDLDRDGKPVGIEFLDRLPCRSG